MDPSLAISAPPPIFQARSPSQFFPALSQTRKIGKSEILQHDPKKILRRDFQKPIYASFSASTQGAKKNLGGFFETAHAQKNKPVGACGSPPGKIFQEDFEMNFSIVIFAARFTQPGPVPGQD